MPKKSANSISKRRRNDAALSPAGLGSDPVGSISGMLGLLSQLAGKMGEGGLSKVSPVQAGIEAGAKVSQEVVEELTPIQQLAKVSQETVLAEQKKNVKEGVTSGRLDPQTILDETAQTLKQNQPINQALAGGGGGGGTGGGVSPVDEETARNAQKFLAMQAGEGTPVGGQQGGGVKDIGNMLQLLVTLGTGLPTPGAMEIFGGVSNKRKVNLQRQLNDLGMSKAEREKFDLLQNAPLKPSEITKMNLKHALDIKKELATAGNVDALTPENAGKFNLLVEGADSLQEIGNILLSDTSKTSGLIVANKFTPSFFKSQTARQLESSIERAIQARTRIETGAAMQADELKKTVKRFIPRVGDSIETVKKRLGPLSNFFEGSVNVADPTGTHRQRATGGQQTQAQLSELIAEAKRRGLM